MKQRDRSIESGRTLTVLATCLLLALALIGLSQTPTFAPVQGVLEQIVAPLQRGFSEAAYGVNSWTQTANNMHALNGENARLREDIARLQKEKAELLALRAENETLRKMLGFQIEFPDLATLPALVVGRDPTGLARILTIDRGSADGVREGMAVTSPGGVLLGRATKVTVHQSVVLLIDDIDSSIPVVVDRTNVAAVVQGEAQHGGRLLVRHLAQGADVGRGDLLKTSGIGGTLPRGLLLGQIYEVHQKDIDLEQEALAYPLAISDSIDQVLVVLAAGQPEGAPRPAAVPTAVGLPTPAGSTPLYPIPPSATPAPTHTPMPTLTPPPSPTPTRTVRAVPTRRP
jgi:rod shape-determining protein MreC